MRRSQTPIVVGVVGGVLLLWLVMCALDGISEKPPASAWLTTFLQSLAQATPSLVSSCLMGAGARPGTATRINEYKDMHVRANVLSKQPHEYVRLEDLPKAWDWRNVNGSCSAQAGLSALADRHKIVRKAQWPDIEYSVQVVLNCVNDSAGSCYGGGDSMSVFQFMHERGLPEESCQPYRARKDECTPINICRNCGPPFGNPESCAAVPDYAVHYVAEYGRVSGELNMMAEIYERGPIACRFDCKLLHYYTGGIFINTDEAQSDHTVSIAGWGEENGIKYWIIRNSWGTYWGEAGWFRLIRGVDSLNIEKDCSWAVPKDAGECWSAQGTAKC